MLEVLASPALLAALELATIVDAVLLEDNVEGGWELGLSLEGETIPEELDVVEVVERPEVADDDGAVVTVDEEVWGADELSVLATEKMPGVGDEDSLTGFENTSSMAVHG